MGFRWIQSKRDSGHKMGYSWRVPSSMRECKDIWNRHPNWRHTQCQFTPSSYTLLIDVHHNCSTMKHKLGGDRAETFQAVPVNENNRLKNAGPAREIQACWKLSLKLLINWLVAFRDGRLLTSLEEATRYPLASLKKHIRVMLIFPRL